MTGVRAAAALLLMGAVAFSGAGAASTSTPAEADGVAPPVNGNEPAHQDVVFWNARLALRNHKPVDVLRLWMLRNALTSAGEVGAHDHEFRSVVWAALGETGMCTDGFIEDDTGAGLWPIAIHNWLLKNLGRQAPSQPDPWPSLRSGMQQRFFSLNDVLSREELKTARFFRADCLVQYRMLPRLPTLHWIDTDDRVSVGLMMRDLLELATATLDERKVEGMALLMTRRFDLDATLSKMTAARVRQEAGLTEQVLRAAGISEGGTQMLRLQRLGEFRTSPDSELWRTAMSWPAGEWLSLSQQRRLSLFGDANAGLADENARKRVILMMVDELQARGDGRELESWLGFGPGAVAGNADANAVAAGIIGQAELVEAVTSGARGERLLGLEPATGFRERSALALHRGVQFLRSGDTLQALRSFAFALAHADESRDAEGVHRLAQRWLSFVLSQYSSTDEVMVILERFVPTIDFNIIVESLVWRAAFHADPTSFERVTRSIRKNGSLQRTAESLRPLAGGDAGKMWNQLEAAGEGQSVYRFAERFIEQLSLEPLDVRANNRVAIEMAIGVLEKADLTAGSSLKKKLNKVRQRAQALLDGIGEFDESVRGRADAGAPDREAYAGSVRLAPADPLPWPFAAPRVTPPNPFTPVVLTPVEWRDENHDLIYGWSIHE